jgi:hypothetical protein
MSTATSLRHLEAAILAPAPARRPAVLRVITGAWTAGYLGSRVTMLRRIHRTDPRLFAPVGPCRVLRRPLPAPLADALVLGCLAADLAFTLGLRHRVVGPVHAGLLLWTLSYRNSWSMIFHNDNVLVLQTAVLGLSPSADALRLGALGPPAVPGPAAREWRYGLATSMVRAVTAATYLVAGVAKLRGPLGWSWTRGESLRRQIAVDALRKELLGSPSAPLGRRLHARTGLFRLLATGSLVVELAAPLALLDQRLARAWAVGAFGMHWGVRALMGIRFRHQQSGVAFVAFFTGGRSGCR